MQCGQCGVISRCKETFGGHLKSFHFALVVSNVSCEMCILVAFLSVSLVNILLRGACELKQVDGFCLVIQNDQNDHHISTVCIGVVGYFMFFGCKLEYVVIYVFLMPTFGAKLST